MLKKGILFIAALLVFTGCTNILNNDSQVEQDDALKVTTSFYVLTDFARQVGGDAVEVTQTSSASADPHSFEPKPQDVARVEESDVFLYNGHGFDEWAENLGQNIEGSTEVIAVLEQGVRENALIEGEAHDHAHEDEEESKDEHLDDHDHDDEHGDDEEEHEHDHSGVDPHAWLSPELAKQYVAEIADAFSKADPDNANLYQENSQNYIEILEKLSGEYADNLSSCSQDTIIVAHNSFSYMGNEYGFAAEAISGLSPDDEPSAQEFASLIEEVKSEGLRYVFADTSSSSKLSETLAKEADITVLELNPLEGLTASEIESGESYVTIMRSNLDSLKTALECR